MQTQDFSFDLDASLIAQNPASVRGGDRLLLLDKTTGAIKHCLMEDLPGLIQKDTVMVFNDSKVRHARVFAKKMSFLKDGTQTQSNVEFMFLHQYQKQPQQKEDVCLWQVMARPARKQRLGDVYTFCDGSVAVICDIQKNTEFRTLCFKQPITEKWFLQNGHVPLPPYIKRKDNLQDTDRYQNVYAKTIGSAACPTAGLHFTQDMLQRLQQKGISLEYITLHVGLGTFLPVRTKNIEDHKMHTEVYSIPSDVAQRLNTAKAQGKSILAVGTTCVRTLEAATDKNGILHSGANSTNIFIYPGYKFKFIDKIFTNFHTPQSTLLMLVCAFAGKENVLNAYKIATQKKYKFFSYGDAMLIL